MEITNALIKSVKSLDSLKHRRENALFKVEGTKCIRDTISAFSMWQLFATDEWISQNQSIVSLATPHSVTKVRQRDLDRMSGMSNPPQAIAVYNIPADDSPDIAQVASRQLVIALDTIQDPGNLGTIIRTADWFGITRIFCNIGSADPYSMKVVQASMGAISRVKVSSCDLPVALASAASEAINIYGTFLDGADIYSTPLSPSGIIVIGNEGNGISPQVAKTVNRHLFIPSFPPNRPTSESLNAAVATAIVVAEFRRRLLE